MMKVLSARISLYNILWVLVFLALFSPPIVGRSSIRVDTIALVPVFFLVLITFRLHIPRDLKVLHLSFFVFVCVIGITTFLQQGLDIVPPSAAAWKPFFGYFRVYLMLLIAIFAIQSPWQARSIVRLLLLGLVVHGVFAVIEYFRISPLDVWLTDFYRNSDVRVGLRAIGAFGYVHGLAFFCMYMLILTISVVNLFPKRIIYPAFVLGAFGFLLPFSRAAYLGLIVAMGIYFLFAYRLKKKARVMVVIALLVAVLMPLIPPQVMEKLSSLGIIWDFIRGKDVLSDPAAGFIVGRIDHGWLHAYEAWRAHPWIGQVLTSQYGFLGDGGYMVLLAGNGVIGFLGYMIAMGGIIYTFCFRIRGNNRLARELKYGGVAIVVALLVANLATGGWGKRILELFPVMIICLYVLARNYSSAEMEARLPERAHFSTCSVQNSLEKHVSCAE